MDPAASNKLLTEWMLMLISYGKTKLFCQWQLATFSCDQSDHNYYYTHNTEYIAIYRWDQTNIKNIFKYIYNAM